MHQKMYQKSFQETLRNFRDEDRLWDGGGESEKNKDDQCWSGQRCSHKKVEEGKREGRASRAEFLTKLRKRWRGGWGWEVGVKELEKPKKQKQRKKKWEGGSRCQESDFFLKGANKWEGGGMIEGLLSRLTKERRCKRRT